jgi:ATP-binding cassette subfamily B protein
MDDPTSVLRKLPLLTLLSPAVRDNVIARFQSIAFPFGSAIIREGEPGDAFFVLVSGRARVVKRTEEGEEVALGVLRPGDSFGEAALLEHTARTASVRASGNCEVLRLDRAGFEDLVAAHPEVRVSLELQVRHRTLVNFFRQHAAFSRLPPAVTLDLVTRLTHLSAAAGDVVIRPGDAPGPIYVVAEGKLRASVEVDGERRDIAFLRGGDVFGEDSLLRGNAWTLTVVAVSASRLYALSRAHFESLVEAWPEFRAEMEERFAQLDYRRVAKVPLDFVSEILPADATAPPAVGDDQVDDEGEAPDPYESPEGFFVRKPTRIRRFPLVRQVDEEDCGAAALAMVCRHFGRRVSLARIRQLVHTSVDGTSLRGLCSAGEELGLAARSVKASRANLPLMPLPAIVHWEGNHWLVLYDVDESHVRIADPARGRRRLTRAAFDRDWTGYAALFDYTPAFADAPEDHVGLSWLWSFARPQSFSVLQAVLLAFVIGAFQMVLPVFTQVVVDDVLVDGDASLLTMLMLAMVAVLVFSTVATAVQRYLLSFVALRVDAASLDYVTWKLLSLPTRYFATRRTGDIQRRLEGMREVRQFLVQHGVAGLMALAQLVLAVAVMLAYSPVLSALFLAAAPLYGFLMFYSSRRLRPTFEDLEEASSRYRSYQLDAIKCIETVKTMGAEGPFRELMLGEFLRVGDKRFNADLTVLLYEGVVAAVSFLSSIVFLWAGALQVLHGRLTIGGLVAFNSLLALANQPILLLLGLWDNAQLAAVLVNRLNDVFAEEPEQGADRSRLVPVPSLEGRVRFENVSFRYGGPESAPILEKITFEAEPGKTIAIVGRSGSGKTTLVKCLAGLLEPTEGTIFFDGVDLRTLNYRDLRRHIGFVLQETYLFDDTIARNIGFGEHEPDGDRVIAAARAANAHAFIQRLPLGYETRIGESGIALSGGQRQRIAIARAIYSRPTVLVFDEATAALDSESERAVKESLDELLVERTAFVIAHRLSTIRDAHQILVIDQGRLVETGDHESLMKRQGLYYYLCAQQLGL